MTQIHGKYVVHSRTIKKILLVASLWIWVWLWDKSVLKLSCVFFYNIWFSKNRNKLVQALARNRCFKKNSVISMTFWDLNLLLSIFNQNKIHVKLKNSVFLHSLWLQKQTSSCLIYPHPLMFIIFKFVTYILSPIVCSLSQYFTTRKLQNYVKLTTINTVCTFKYIQF